jgi:hypothetical protein
MGNIPEEIKQKIEDKFKDTSGGNYAILGAIFGYSLAQKELEEKNQIILNQSIQLHEKDNLIKEYREGLTKISQMSDPGSPEAGIIYMKNIAQSLLNKK